MNIEGGACYPARDLFMRGPERHSVSLVDREVEFSCPRDRENRPLHCWVLREKENQVTPGFLLGRK